MSGASLLTIIQVVEGRVVHVRKKNEARSIELLRRVVTQSQLPFSLAAAFDGSEPKIEAGPSRLDWKCTNAYAIPFNLIVALRQVIFMYN